MEMISLASGATYFNTPEPACQAAMAAIAQHKTFYAEAAGTAALRQAIARRYHEHNQAQVDPENILVTPGTKQALYNVLQAIIKPGDEVIVPAPNWFGLYRMLQVLQARPVLWPTHLSEHYALRPEKLQQMITPRTRVLLFSNPCNPTGRRYSPEELTSLLQVTARHADLYVLSDEIYDLVYYGEPIPSLLQMPDPRQRHLVVNGFSKSFAMAGWRIGYLITPPALSPGCREFQHVTYSGVSEFVQEAALVIMRDYKQLLPPMLEVLRQNRAALCQFLHAHDIRFYEPEAGYYVFPDLNPYLSDRLSTVSQLVEWLKAHYALEILSGDLFGAPGFARLSFGVETAHLQEALQRLDKALKELAGRRRS